MSDSIVSVEMRGRGTVGELKGANQQFYEDRFRLLSAEIDLVQEAARGEIFAVFDGVGSAPMGMRSAQAMADALIEFYTEPDQHKPTSDGLRQLILTANQRVFEWGMIPVTNLPLGGCAGTIAWISGEKVTVFHAGDTECWLFRDGACLNIVGRDAGGKTLLTEYFGKGDQLELTSREFLMAPGEKLVLFTDGLRKVLSQSRINEVLCCSDPPGDTIHNLLTSLEREGAPDDVTLLVITF